MGEVKRVERLSGFNNAVSIVKQLAHGSSNDLLGLLSVIG